MAVVVPAEPSQIVEIGVDTASRRETRQNVGPAVISRATTRRCACNEQTLTRRRRPTWRTGKVAAEVPRVKARTVAEHRQQVLEGLYRSFESLIYDRGYDAIALADVAKESRMARTAIYNYFPDKESLLLAYTAHEMDEFFSDLRAELHRIDDPLERLDAYVRAQLTYFATHHLPPGPALRSVLSSEGYTAMREHGEILEVTLSAILEEAAADGLIPEAVPHDGHTIPLVLACLAAGPAAGRDDEQLDVTVASTQIFVRRAVGAPPSEGA